MQVIKRMGMALASALLCTTTSSLGQTTPQPNDLRPLHGDWSAAELIGARVRSVDGGDIGEIQDLVFSSDAQVVTAVVSVGGFLDIADKLVAIPYGDLRVRSDENALAIPLTSAEIEAAPAYKGHPPAAGDAKSLVDPDRVAPPGAAIRREAEAEASRAFAGDDPRVGDGIAENKKAYEEQDAAPQP
jgi:sporulation protein YlmC with PRC-barrel domain